MPGSTSSDDVEGIPCEINGQEYYIEDNSSHPRAHTHLEVWDKNGHSIGHVSDHEFINQWLLQHMDFAVRYRQAQQLAEAHGTPRTMRSSGNGSSARSSDDFMNVSPERTGASPLSPEMLSPTHTGASPRRIGASSVDSYHVQVHADTTQCMYYYNAATNPHSFTQTQPDTMYPISLLACATPVGMMRVDQLIQETDFNIDYNVFRLNTLNIRRSAFQLTKNSPDRSKRVIVTIPAPHPVQIVAHIDPRNGISEFIALYIPPGVGMPAMSYHTDIVWTVLTVGVNCQQFQSPTNQNDSITLIDPETMTMQFLETLDNVHITGDLNIESCPTERLIAARIDTPPPLAQPICALLNHLNTTLPDHAFSLFRLPYVYEIDVQTQTCIKTPIKPEIITINTERDLSYLSQQMYDQHILPHESALIQNMLFQMMFVYEKRGQEFKDNCPPHKMLFDFYLRRDSSQVVFHYDRTPFFEVSTLSLLFSMPPGMTRPGPHIAPLPTTVDPTMPDGMRYTDPGDGVSPDVCTFQVRNGTCVMVNNSVVTHSTPGMDQLFARGNQWVPWMGQDNYRMFNFPEMHVPGAYQQRMRETRSIPRSFLRMWHVVSDPTHDPQYFGEPELMFDGHFPEMIDHGLLIQEEWIRQAQCICMKITSAAPTELRGAIQGSVRGLFGGRKSTTNRVLRKTKYKSKTVAFSPKAKSDLIHATKYPIRASTLSNIREKIKSKLMQIKKIYQDVTKNVLIMNEIHKAMRSRRTPHQSRSLIRRRTRKVNPKKNDK